MNTGIPGQTVSHDRVIEPLGEGGMGVVSSELRSCHGGSSEAVEGTFLLADLMARSQRSDRELAGHPWLDLARKFPGRAGEAAWQAGELFGRREKDLERAREAYSLVPQGSRRYRDAQKKLQR